MAPAQLFRNAVGSTRKDTREENSVCDKDIGQPDARPLRKLVGVQPQPFWDSHLDQKAECFVSSPLLPGPCCRTVASLRVQIYSSTTEMFNSPTPLNDLIPSHVFLQQGDMHRSSSRDGQPLLRCSILMLLRIWQTGISSNKSINSSSARPPPRMFFHFKKSNAN